MPFLIIFVPAVDPGPDSTPGGLLSVLLFINILLNLPIDPFSSFGLFRIARHRDIPLPWLAWIPLVNLWTLGCIADKYRKITGKRTGLRWILLVYILFVTWMCLAFWGPESVTSRIGTIPHDYFLPHLLLGVLGITAIYVSLNNLYKYSWVDDPTSYTVLSLVFSIPTPFLICKCAKYDF